MVARSPMALPTKSATTSASSQLIWERKSMLEIENLQPFYGQIRALNGVNLNVKAGQIFSVLGANGAGKTTLLRSILGLTRVTGKIAFQGQDITQLPTPERVRRGIALVPEGRRLFPDF